MVAFVYTLCTLLSFTCFVFLWNGYKENKIRLLFWCAIGFAGFALNNFLLFLDVVILDTMTIQELRTLPALLGLTFMVFGLIKESP